MFKVMRAWDKGRNKIAYVHRNEETGRTKISEVGFQNWFYVKLSDYEKFKDIFTKFKNDGVVVEYETVNKYVKVYVDTIHNDELLDKDMDWVWEYKRWNTNQLLDKLKTMGIVTFEADVKAYKRWLLQDNVAIETKYKVLYYDIETDDRHADGLTPGKYRIVSFAAKSSDSDDLNGKMYWFALEEDSDEAECALMKKLAKLINMHDVVISFNGSMFDDPYIKCRFMRYGIEIDWRKKFLQDHCWVYKKYGPKLISHKLDNIAKGVLGRGKVDTGERIWTMWESNRELLKKYNIEDVQLMYEIECKTGFLGAHRDICAEGRCSVDDIYVSRKIDNFILKQAEIDNEYHFKTMEWEEEKEKGSFEGAYVFTPKPGRYKKVRVLDFGSLYPTIIRTFNISPDTFIETSEENKHILKSGNYITTPNNHRYRKDITGILAKVVTRLAAKRKHYKDLMSKETEGTMEHKVLDKMQYLYKYFGLSFYGCMGEKNNRAYDTRIAESITLSAQYMIKICSKYLSMLGYETICGQTDSLFIDGIEDEKIEQICKNLNRLCEKKAIEKFNCDSSCITMEYDKGFKTFFLGNAKLRYAGVLDYIDGHEVTDFNLKITGFEYVRTDICQIVKKKQYELLKMLLEGEEVPSVDCVRDFVLKLRDMTLNRNLSLEDIQAAQKLTKEIDEYNGRQMHTMVAKQMIADGKEMWVGDKVPYYVVAMDSDNKPIPAAVYKFEGKYCESYYWNQKIFPPLQRIVEVIYPNVNWKDYLIKGRGQVKLGRTGLW